MKTQNRNWLCFRHPDRLCETITRFSKAATPFIRLLNDAALAAARRYQYEPYLVNGKATPFITRVEVVFSLRLAYDNMVCAGCDDEAKRVRQDYMRTLRSIIEYHLIAAEQAGATSETKQIRKLKQSLLE